eukprot:TRINITY_DN7136_c0_g2_i1.p1 TRINITY_DN7136_c0_g2~~TRINITY_DN7136_c0_g2_i1.p1  ORF type:complete len:202 (-),score=14.37 TRINITY_DN7136_c0_g2_i1:226-741(-)
MKAHSVPAIVALIHLGCACSLALGPTDPVVKAQSGVGPAWTRGKMEPPAGDKDMGGWIARVYTEEQQKRLGVDENGVPQQRAVLRPDSPRPAAAKQAQVGNRSSTAKASPAISQDRSEEVVAVATGMAENTGSNAGSTRWWLFVITPIAVIGFTLQRASAVVKGADSKSIV